MGMLKGYMKCISDINLLLLLLLFVSMSIAAVIRIKTLWPNSSGQHVAAIVR
jgi:hypothetical protein